MINRGVEIDFQCPDSVLSKFIYLCVIKEVETMKNLKFRNGDVFPIIGLGTYLSKRNDVYDAVIEAIRIGYRHIDCASVYGNEAEIGEALKFVLENGIVRRDELFITSKLWNSDHAPEQVEAAIRKSLNRLQLDYLDLYLMHWPIAFKTGHEQAREASDLVSLDEMPIEVTWQAMEKVQQAGLTKHIGVSNFTISKLKDLKSKFTICPEVNQVELHPYFQQPELLAFCKQQNILVTAFSPLGSRHLIAGDESITNNIIVISIAAKHNCTPSQVLLAWGMKRGTVVIPKSVHSDRIRDNFNSTLVELDSADMIAMSNIDKKMRLAKGLYAVLPGGCYTLENIWDN